MGSLIPSGGDANVIAKLDARFSGQPLQNLRNFINGTDAHFLHPPRHLRRISYRLKIWPDGLKGRWFYFLKHLLPNTAQDDPQGHPSTVAVVIRDALRDFVADTNCTQVSFHVQPDVQGTLPNGIDYRADIIPSPAARPAHAYPASITLVCRQEIPQGVSEPDPTAKDTGENGPDQPNI
ncbi:hypothetical protein [Bradyrhizobium guangdongense]|uniref:hypothetical protein n=1 Tax=Bradyrhizobium guangdongense TaxID=1325090 RepID=UPI00131A0434|nr:hypothetical protein [Bradyrhizobium guangdongense]